MTLNLGKLDPSITVLMADDDPDDRRLAIDAFRAAQLSNPLHFVEDGAALLDYLNRRDRYTDTAHPLPGLILLDLNMPRVDGREALQEIKSDPLLRHIPIIVLTTSAAEEDIARSYRAGCNSFIQKPVSFSAFVEIVSTLGRYWFSVVDLPEGSSQ
ncbi:MAG TPA: response regulator [Tahibacter sp.]|nr:response regulator [Tahibacter sp.]